jgi:hypothetical protein
LERGDPLTLVAGQVWLVTFEALCWVDRMEGTRSATGLHNREFVYAFGCKSGTVVKAWGYLWRGKRNTLGPRIDCGHWGSWLADDENEERAAVCAESLALAT